MMKLRKYQSEIISKVFNAWKKHKNIILQLSTGAGKTVTFVEIALIMDKKTIILVHRQELLYQVSSMLASRGVGHQLIAQDKSIRNAISFHQDQFGDSFVRYDSKIIVAMIDTFVRLPQREWENKISLVIIDEGHHVLRENKWGKCFLRFKNAKGLFPTATPVRADKKGLGHDYDGLANIIIQGPSMINLMEQGYLCDYKIFSPPSDIDFDAIIVSKDGDFSLPSLEKTVSKSCIIGDIVEHYMMHAHGLLGITFVVSIKFAELLVEKYMGAGVPTAILHANISPKERSEIMRKFRNREILQIVNVDILGEGVDIPGVEVISFARPTMSYALYAQQFGRGLRPCEGKSHCIIIDHVDNVLRHGLPDTPRTWSLLPARKKINKDNPYIRKCIKCSFIFSLSVCECPACGFINERKDRGEIEINNGYLREIDIKKYRTKKIEPHKINNYVDAKQTTSPGSYSAGEALTLRIHPRGSKCWQVEFVRNKKRFRRVIGLASSMTLDEARELALKLKCSDDPESLLPPRFAEEDIPHLSEGLTTFDTNLSIITKAPKRGKEPNRYWIFRKRIGDKRPKLYIGKWPEMSIEEAIKESKRLNSCYILK